MNDRGHLSVETIDLLALSSLSPTKEQDARAHLSSCDSCQARLSELEEDKAHFQRFVFPRTVAKVEERARTWALPDRLRGYWKMWIPALGMAAAAALVFVTAPSSQTEDEPYIGVKGVSLPLFEVVASRPEGSQFQVKDGTRLRPKDRIRFVVEPAGARFLLIASKDGQGNVTVYHPYGGQQSAPVQPGKRELPGSIELDEVLGRERLVAVFSDSPISAERVKDELARADSPHLIPGTRALVSLLFTKEP
ncbi:MAG: hypothetical protein HYZ28_11325 [Myxococcales bacterium]|nr:hypothetical protein [Myxococcales bacterium]